MPVSHPPLPTCNHGGKVLNIILPFNSTFQPPKAREIAIIVPVSQMKKLRPKDVKKLVLKTANKRWGLAFEPKARPEQRLPCKSLWALP